MPNLRKIKMKKLLISSLVLAPSIAFAHTGSAHSHPEELTGGLILLAAAIGAYYIWKNR